VNKQEVLFRILLIDDNEDSIIIAKRALKQIGFNNELYIAETGEKGLGFLSKCKDEDKTGSCCLYPGLILLDINLPKIDGMEVLREIKNNPDFKKIPTVVLTGSNRDADKIKSYELGCNSYIQKSSRFEDFVNIIKQTVEYWGLINNPPPCKEED
jgi:two-component system, response regulator